ncbi:hypothetical protein DH2020_032323 [Rehmannia glutinosa]|uniref:FBD domain-containing protein n=1 Tax=Rehmannia glutinosa TaxID=99300 RepID=A0ABR0VIF0_REHGL
MERKRIKASGEQNKPSIDILSDLPDDVICHILSFLPTKFSVATSILAKRWRLLWTHVPNIDIANGDFTDKNHAPEIITRVLLRNKAQRINTCRLNYDDSCSEHETETWISTVISRNVQYFDINLNYRCLRLPQCLFTCKTVVNLTIHNCAGIPSSGDIYLPSLKKLGLYYVKYGTDEAILHLLSGCPMLEELIIDEIADQDLGCFNISSPTIKSLEVNFPCESFEFDNPDYRVKINAPALRYLKVYDCSYEQMSLSPLTSLIEAEIHFKYYSLEVDYSIYTRCVFKFLDSLCNVKCLKLSSSDEFIDFSKPDPYVRFQNLTELEVSADWRLLVKFLECADNDPKNPMETMEKWRACLLYSLTTVIIDGFVCTEQEFNIVRFILRNARVLKRMEIHRIGSKEKFDVVEKILLFNRGSKECEIAFCYDCRRHARFRQ